MALTRAGRAKLDRLQVEDPAKDLPWGGRSPRHLTEAYSLFKLRPETPSVDEECELSDQLLDEQYRRFHNGS